MSKRNAISYIKQDEPTFLKNFKTKVGYVEGPDVETKRQVQPPVDDDDDDRSDTEEERPQVVVLKKGDLSAEDVENLRTEEESIAKTFDIGDSCHGDESPRDGKIVFKKPTKRSSDEPSDLTTSSSKKKKEEMIKDKSSSKATKNSSLLSFGDEDEEDSDE